MNKVNLEIAARNIIGLGEETASKRMHEVAELKKAKEITREDILDIHRKTDNLVERGELIQELGAHRYTVYKASENALYLDLAICYAVARHAGQYRKGTHRSYITHPLEVMNILVNMDAYVGLQIAGVLHDTVEDTDATIEEIAKLFGDDVAEYIASISEDKSKSWDERKSHSIKSIAGANDKVKMLIMADKLSNLRSMACDYGLVGERMWERFNAPKEKLAWYYSEMAIALQDMQNNKSAKSAYQEMVDLVNVLFGKRV